MQNRRPKYERFIKRKLKGRILLSFNITNFYKNSVKSTFQIVQKIIPLFLFAIHYVMTLKRVIILYVHNILQKRPTKRERNAQVFSFQARLDRLAKLEKTERRGKTCKRGAPCFVCKTANQNALRLIST